MNAIPLFGEALIQARLIAMTAPKSVSGAALAKEIGISPSRTCEWRNIGRQMLESGATQEQMRARASSRTYAQQRWEPENQLPVNLEEPVRNPDDLPRFLIEHVGHGRCQFTDRHTGKTRRCDSLAQARQQVVDETGNRFDIRLVEER